MATHDYVIANGTGAAVRSDLNGALAAIVSNNSSATEPATMYAYQWWPDTTTGLLKQRNSANSAWITIGTLASANLGLLSLAGGTMTGALAVTAGTAALPGIAVSGDLNTGIYSPGADQVAISTGGTQRINIEADGDINIDSGGVFYDATNNRLGIGSSLPQAELNVAKTGGASTVYIESDAGNNATTSILRFGGASGRSASIQGFRGSSSNIQSLDFYTYNSADVFGMRLTSTGLGIGTIASPANQLQLSTDSAGKPSTSLWTIVSDERIKEDIELADLDLCYEAIKAIPLKRYKWRDDIYTAEQVTDRRKLGWIAQDVEAIFPKAVGTHKFKYNQVFEETIIPAVKEKLGADGNVITPAQPERIEQGDLISEDVIEDCRDLNSDQLYAAMYGAVQKLMAKVETLEASNTDLLARLSALEAA